MKKFAVSCGAVLLALFALTFVWLQTPSVQDPSYVDEVKEEVEARFAAQQKLAAEEAENGFLDPVFSEYWGRKNLEFQPGSKVSVEVELFRDKFSSVAGGQVLDQKKLLADEEAQKARQDFEARLPGLKEALAKPYFIPPETEISLDNIVPNFLSVRSLGLALSGYCEQLVAEGKAAEALPYLYLVFDLGNKMAETETLMSTMIGVSIESTGLQTITGLFGPSADLQAGEWKSLANFLFEKRPSKDLAYHCMQAEFYAIQKELDSSNAGTVPVSGTGVFRYIPGLMSRENRILQNVCTDMLIALRDDKPDPTTNLSLDWRGYLSGRVGVMSAIMVPNLFRARSQIKILDQRLLGHGLSAGLLAYKKEKGSFPKALVNLEEVGVNLPAHRSEIEYKVSDESAELKIELKDTQDDGFVDLGPFYERGGWARVKDGRLIFELK